MPRKLGKVQQLVLCNVSQGLEPYKGHTTFSEYTNRMATADKLRKRGYLRLLPHNHPLVTTGGCQWRLTASGADALEACTRR